MAARAESKNGKYDQILKAAIKVFAKNGYFNSKVADVARAAGVADGTVYLYFKNKDDILVSIFTTVMEDVIGSLKEALSRMGDPLEKLRHVAVAHFRRMSSDRSLAIVFQVELRQSTKFMQQFSSTKVQQYFSVIEQVIREAQRQKVFREDLDSKLATKFFFGALDEMTTNWILSRRRYDLVAMADAVFDVFVNGAGIRKSIGRRA